MDMESRKVQAVGSSTLAVSLPKSWTKARNLKKGDQLLMIQEGDYLKLIDSSSIADDNIRSAPQYVINADMCQEPGMLERIIVGNYVLGREKWTIKSKTKLKSKQHREIRNVSWKLIGLGIIEETADSMSLQCSIDPSKYPIEGLVKRLFNLSLMMFDESIESLLTNDLQLAEDVIKREDDADMIYWLCLKLILSVQMDDSLMEKVGLGNRLEIVGYRLIIKDIESIADHSEEIAENVITLLKNDISLPDNLLKTITKLSAKVKELYEKTLEALQNKNIAQANQAIKMRNEIRKRENEVERIMLKEVNDSLSLICLRNITYNLHIITDYALSISVIVINRCLVNPSELCKPIINE